MTQKQQYRLTFPGEFARLLFPKTIFGVTVGVDFSAAEAAGWKVYGRSTDPTHMERDFDCAHAAQRCQLETETRFAQVRK